MLTADDETPDEDLDDTDELCPECGESIEDCECEEEDDDDLLIDVDDEDDEDELDDDEISW
jgi:hypothetical protein